MTWDDHDYGYNDFGKDYPYKIQSKKLFLDFWEVKKMILDGVMKMAFTMLKILKLPRIILGLFY